MRYATLLGIGTLLFALLAPTARGQAEWTQAGLLRRMVDVRRLAEPTRSFEQTRVFCTPACGESDAANWRTVADLNHRGFITHIWCAATETRIRVVVDGETAIETTYGELTSGNLEPFAAPLVDPHTGCDFPIGFAEHGRVDVLGAAPAQVVMVQAEPNSRVARFNSKLDNAAKAALDEVSQAFVLGLSDQQLSAGSRLMPVAVKSELGPTDRLVETLEGAGTVRSLYIALTDRRDPSELYALHRWVLRIFVDGEGDPSVEAPLCDFFGSGFDLQPLRSLVMGTDGRLELPLPDRAPGSDRFCYCFFPMPYRNGMRLEIENLNESRQRVGVLLHLRVDTRPPAPNALRFRARFRAAHRADGNFSLLKAIGGGYLVGYVLNLDGAEADGWRGSTLTIDNNPLRCEDASLASWRTLAAVADRHVRVGPLQGVTRVGPFAKRSGYRWLVAEAIPITKELRLRLTSPMLDGSKYAYASGVAFWYAEPDHPHATVRLKRGDLTPPDPHIPGALEIEDLIVTPNWGNVMRQQHAGDVELSGGEAANITLDGPVTINVPAERDETVGLLLRVHPERTFDPITVRDADGTKIGTIEHTRAPHGIYPVGIVKLRKGLNAMTIESPGRTLLDCWLLERKEE